MKPFNARRAPIYARHGIACSSQPLAAAVGRDILRAGGNAVDAAVAMAAMVNLTEPMMNGLGGDCFALVRFGGEIFALNGSGRSGSRCTVEAIRAQGHSRMPKAGAATVTVPGALDGYLALHERFGSMDLADLVAPAVDYAEEGCPVGLKISQVWHWGASKLQHFNTTPEAYLPGGRPPSAGDIFQQADLAGTWRHIGRHGRAAFYGGRVRDAILDIVNSRGGFLEAVDFDTVQAEWVEPIRAKYRDHTVLELPPNGQGIVVLEALRILEGYDLKASFASDEAAASHLILEALKIAFADAERHVADPRFRQTPVERLLSDDYIAARRSLIDPARALDNPCAGRVYGDTTYLTVMDKDRNAVSLITSISDVFGSGLIVPGAGVVLHNRGADFELEDDHPNVAAPGKRVRHTILPAMLLDPADEFTMTFGCMGANMQPQGQVQILVNLLDRGMNLQEALDAPRVRVLDGRRVSVEAHADPSVARKLAAVGHQVSVGDEIPQDWEAPHDFMRSFEGSAQAIAISGSALCGASDPRLDGIAVGY
jgi:gamma-glutamyltranspeptidase/glutathione hydrolase